MRDKLKKLLMTDVECNKCGHGDCSMCEYEYSDEKCFEHMSAIIADYLLANGVIVLPCKIGDIVYTINSSYTKCHLGRYYDEDLCAGCESETCESKKIYKIKEEEVIAIKFNNSGFFVKTYSDVFSYKSIFDATNKITEHTAFLTRKEAEKALAEKNKNN